jgi:hypothetical protein
MTMRSQKAPRQKNAKRPRRSLNANLVCAPPSPERTKRPTSAHLLALDGREGRFYLYFTYDVFFSRTAKKPLVNAWRRKRCAWHEALPFIERKQLQKLGKRENHIAVT